jgi:AcrR family transcriptional regulator
MTVGSPNSVQEVGRAQRRASRTRRRLLEGALAMFAEKGVDATTIQNITERADVGKGTFYRHFTNKDEVVIAVVEEAAAQLIARLQAPGKPRQNLEQALEHLLDVHMSFYVAGSERFLLMFRGRVLLKLERDATSELGRPYMLYLAEIEKQIAPFGPRPLEPLKVRRLASAVAGFVSGFASFAMLGRQASEIEKTLEPLRRVFVAASSGFLNR